MSNYYNKNLIPNSQKLRRNMTPEERHLWYDFLKKLPLTVKRQYVIGNFIVDFCIESKRLIIELDGIQHKTREHFAKDNERDDKLAEFGYKVVRYSNIQISSDFENVCSDIKNLIK